MRVPTIDSPSVASKEPYSNTSPYLQKPDGQIGDALRGLGRSLGDATGSMIEAGQRIEHEADAVNVADGYSELQRYSTELSYGVKRADGSMEPGFLSLQGKAAFEANADYMEKLEKKRAEITNGLMNEDQRRAFRLHSNKLVENTRADFGKHAYQQSAEIKAKSVDGLHQSLLSIASSAPDDADRIAEAMAAYFEQSLNMLGPTEMSKEQQKAFVSSTYGDVAAAKISSYIAQETPEKAKSMLEDQRVRDDLGTRYDDVQKLTNRAMDAKQVKIDQAQADAQTESVLGERDSRSEDGLVDEVVARNKADSLEFESPKAKALFEKAFDRQMRDELKKKKGTIQGWVGAGQVAFTDGGWHISSIPPEIQEKVKQYDPKQWDRWVTKEKEVREGYAREARIGSSGNKSAQADENRRAKAMLAMELVGLDQEDRKNFNVDAFIAEKGLWPSPGTAAELRNYKAQKVSADGHMNDKTEEKFLRETLKSVDTEIKRLGGATKTNPGDVAKIARLRADAVSAASEAYDLNISIKKAPLTSEEQTKVRASIAGDVTAKHNWITKDKVVPAFVVPEYNRKTGGDVQRPAPDIVVQSPAPKKTTAKTAAPGRYYDPSSKRYIIIGKDGSRKWE